MITLEALPVSKPERQRLPRAYWYVIILILAGYGVSMGLQLGHPIVGDEIRYLDYARNLLNGTYALARDGGIRNGPGYPLFLAPFIALGIPEIGLRLTNLVFVGLGLLYVYSTIVLYTSRRVAWLTTVLLAAYPPLMFLSGQLMTEAFGLFLFAGFVYHWFVWQRPELGRRRNLLL